MAAHVYWRLRIIKAGTISGGTTTGYFPCVGEWVSYDSGGSTLSLSGATFSASSSVSSGFLPGNAFDGNESTLWHANFIPSSGSPEWLQVQFASGVDIDHFSLTTGSGRQSQGVDTFSLQYSDDGVVWNDKFAYQGPQWGSSEGPQMFYTTGAVYKVSATANDFTSGGINLAELKFYDSSRSQISTSTGTPMSTLASGSQTPDLVFDGNSSTFFASSDAVSSGNPQFVSFHFPVDHSIDSILIQAEGASNQHVFSPSAFTFQKSTDGGTWSILKTFTAIHWDQDGQVKNFYISPNHTHTIDAGSLSSVWSSPIDTTGCDLIVVSVGFDGTGTLTDSQSNTWTALTANSSGGNPQHNQIFYCLMPSTSANHTFNFAGSSTAPVLAVAAFTGFGTATVTQQSGAGATSGTTLATGSVPALAGDLVITTCSENTAVTKTINLSFSILDQNQFQAGVHYGGALATLIPSSTGNVNPTWTYSTSTTKAESIAVFSVGGIATSQPIIQVIT